MTEVTVDDNIVLITSNNFKEVEEAILNFIRSWNNFHSSEGTKIELQKLPDPDALQASSSEEVRSADIFGRG